MSQFRQTRRVGNALLGTETLQSLDNAPQG